MCTGREMGFISHDPEKNLEPWFPPEMCRGKIPNPDSRPKVLGNAYFPPDFGDPDPQKFNPSLTCSGRGPHSPLRIFFVAIGTPWNCVFSIYDFMMQLFGCVLAQKSTRYYDVIAKKIDFSSVRPRPFTPFWLILTHCDGFLTLVRVLFDRSG